MFFASNDKPVIDIDPGNLGDNNSPQAKLIRMLLQQRPQQTFFEKGKVYDVNGERIQLNKSLLRRNKMIEGLDKPITKYDVLGDTLASGSFGRVYPIIGTMTLRNTSIHYKHDNRHVVKMTIDYDELEGPPEEAPPLLPTSTSEVEIERRFMSQGTRFRPKPLTHQRLSIDAQQSFLTTRKFPGVSLKEVTRRNNLTTEQRLRLTIALLSALKKQVHDLGMIHRDIKPENIIVNIDTMEVNIIDLGLSVSSQVYDGRSCGTPGFTAPEVINRVRLDFRADIFSMGRTLATVWGDNSNIWRVKRVQDLIAKTYEGKFNLKELFKKPSPDAFDDTNDDQRLIITKLIGNMSEINPYTRRGIEDLINMFHHTYLISKGYPEGNKNLAVAFSEGRKLEFRLRNNKDAEAFKGALATALEKINDTPEEIQEFTHGLGWHSLSAVRSKEEIHLKVNEILGNHQECKRQYMQIKKEALLLLDKLSVISQSGLTNELQNFIIELNNKIYRMIERPLDLDLLQQSAHFLNQHIGQWQARIDEIKTEIEHDKRYETIKSVVESLRAREAARPAQQPAEAQPPQQPPRDPAKIKLDKFKHALLSAITSYVHHTVDDNTLQEEKRAASSRRKQDIQDLTTIIDNAASVDELIHATKARLGQMQFGFFGRSQLKTNVEAVIEAYSMRKK